jgi:hypothetical protein
LLKEIVVKGGGIATSLDVESSGRNSKCGAILGSSHTVVQLNVNMMK